MKSSGERLDAQLAEATDAIARSRALLGPAPAVQPIVPRTRKTVLLVDDEPMIANVIRNLLEPLGVELIVATTIEAAWQALGRHPIGAAIVDWTFPEGTTPAIFLRTLRYSGIDARVLSGYDVNPDETQGFSVVQKGGSLESLVRWISGDETRATFVLPLEERARFAAAEELAHALLPVGIDRLLVAGSAAWDGTCRIRRRLDGLAPLREMEPVYVVAIRERVRGCNITAPVPPAKCTVLEAPPGLAVHVDESGSGEWHEWVVNFPGGWELRAHPGRVTLAVESEIPGAFVFSTDGPQPLFSQHVRRAVGRLELFLEFPPGWEPERWLQPIAWWGIEPDAEGRNIIRAGACYAFEWSATGSSARLAVERPHLGCSFALAWTIGPAERLEAARRAALEVQP